MVISQKQYNSLWFASIVLLLFVQYVRPQDLISGLQQAPLFMPVAGLVLLFTLFSKHFMSVFGHSQIRLTILFFAWMVFLVPFSQSPGAAVRGLVNFIPLFPFVIAIPLLVKDVKTLHKMVDVFVTLTLIIGCIGLATGGGRYSTFGLGNFLTDPNDYALFMNVVLPICFFMFMFEKQSMLKKAFYGTAAVLALASIVASYSRGGFLALLCVATIMWWFSPNRKLSASIGAVLLFGVVLLSSNQWKETVSTSFDASQSTAQTRLTTWKLSVKAFVDHPVGIGMMNIPPIMYRYASSAENPDRWWGDVNHSFWFTALAEGGIIGFTLIMMLLYHNVRDCLWLSRVNPLNDDLRFMKYIGYAYIGSLVGFLSAGTFLTVNYYPHLWYMSAMIAASGGILYKLSKEYAKQ